MTSRQVGFSLLEMALSLVVLGFLFAMVPMAMSTLKSAQGVVPALDRAKLAINTAVGFIIQHDRLPCPDTSGDGLENCSGGSRSGLFPYLTAGLGQPLVNESGFSLHYAVYQQDSANLTALQDSYEPSFLANEVSGQRNALDFCQGLKQGLMQNLSAVLSDEPHVAAYAGGEGVNPAFLFVDPGSLDADRDGRLFDGDNANGLKYESPGRAQSDGYDDQVIAVGFAELSARLSCPQVVARVSAAVREANAAFDAKRAYAFYLTFREFGEDVRRTNLKSAKLKQQIAQFNSAAQAAATLLDIKSALSGAGAGTLAVTAVNAGIAVYSIEQDLRTTAADVEETQQELDIAEEHVSNAVVADDDAAAYLGRAMQAARVRDARGWFQ